MNVQEIKVFQTVVCERSITKASKKLYMTPQGVSRVIKNLEAEFDCELFVRVSKGMELTESGRCFARHTSEMTAHYREMRDELDKIKQKDHGVVDLLSAYGIIRLLSPDCLLGFQKKHPDIEFHYREFPDRRVERLFRGREGNVIFSIGDFDEDLFNISELISMPLRLLVYEGHPLAQKESVTIEDLKGEPLYLECQEFESYHIIVDKCRQAGFEPNIVFETSGFSLCHKMVREKKGISVTLDFMFNDMRGDGLISIPFSDGDYAWKICMLTRKEDTPGRAVDLFCKHVKECLKYQMQENQRLSNMTKIIND